MMKPIAVLGTDGAIGGSFTRSTEAAFAATGANTGNLAFQYAAFQRVIGDDRFTVPFAFDVDAVRDRARLICIPAANFLYSGFDLGDLAKRLEATGLPLMVLGLGAQAFRSVNEVQLKPGTERLLHLFRERCARIMLRGSYTAAVLERYGVQNFEVLGCPSNFINPSSHLGASIAERLRTKPFQAVALAPTFYSYNAKGERALLDEFGEDRVTHLIAQDPLAAIMLARREIDAPEVTTWLSEKAGLLTEMTKAERDLWVGRLRGYFSAEAWLEAYQSVDAVIGTRIHGAALGWQAGRSALVISFDLRTEELAATMGLPLVKAAALAPGGAEAALRAGVEACAPLYDARRMDLAGRLVRLLGEHGVTPGPVLRSLAAGETASLPTEASAGAMPAALKPTSWGFLEQYNRRRIAGWVASSSPAAPRLTVRLDGKELATVTPSTSRPDISGYAWAFEVKIPSDAKIPDVAKVEVIFADTGAPLRNSPVITSFAAQDETKVLRGQGGYLFLQNDSNAVLEQVQGRRILSAEELDLWEHFFLGVDAAAFKNGAHVLYLIAPNKECVFAEALPSGIAVSENRPVRQVQALAARLDLRATRIIYPLEAMRRAKADVATYPKGDSHWSDYGASLALDAVYEAIGLDNLAAGSSPGPDAFQVEYRNADLLSKLGGVCVEEQPVLRRRPAARVVHDNGILNTGRRRELRPAARPAASGHLLMLHDSFGEWLIPPLAENFASTTAVWNASLAESMLEQEQPDVLLFERAERFLVVPPRFG
ncbi:hypothetical protein EAH89_28955 [Roseomonas nepalensis]|uniref:Polysaccharide pyruvyl transferase domain-containing protein n=1 Tax=Muricoccus nepalensis TaxID=1854500 RepID=A0A502EVX1_9PROT|nr:polysaccharide pyruvyl transferase family protein [Roseomonas nepalensis]TPG40271.1 hypothetical protein EAH89_28955 [Roseomonas nepalensis]